MRVKFVGEKGRPATDGVAIAGLAFCKGQELRLSAAQVAALRAHPQFGQFEFDISETARVGTVIPVKRARKPSTAPKKRQVTARP